jgi:hypothetical protein
MISYIKVLEPPLLKAIKELEKISFDFPQVCIMDEAIMQNIPKSLARDLGGIVEYTDQVMGFFYRRTGVKIKIERCKNIISDANETLGEYDFFFEWVEPPNMEQIQDLIKKIDKSLMPLGCFYTITTKK